MKPTSGQQYKTLEGDTLNKIASQAYGNPNKHSFIIDVNQLQTKLTADGTIPTGTVLIIPIDNELDSLRQDQLSQGLR